MGFTRRAGREGEGSKYGLGEGAGHSQRGAASGVKLCSVREAAR